MSAFEALFAFYGLLLGLAIAAVTTGFGEQWRRRRTRPVGWMVPLLGLYVLLAATQQWMSFWGARDHLVITPPSLLMCLGMALPYTFVAQVMFPATDNDVADGDTHYLAERRVFLGVLVLPLALSLTYNLIANPTGVTDDFFGNVISRIVPIILFMALIPIRRRTWQIAGLSVLIFDRLLVILL